MEGQQYYQAESGDVLAALGSTRDGLSDHDAARRRREYGPNELRESVSPPLWLLFLSQFRELLIIILIIGGFISLLIGNVRDGAIIFIIVAVNAVIGFHHERRADRTIEGLKTLIRSPAKVMRDGELTEIRQENLVPGDVVRLDAGDKIPADIRLLEVGDFSTSDFALTGESVPRVRETAAIAGEVPLADRVNMAFAGTMVAAGSALGVVTATGMETETGRIARLVTRAGTVATPLQRELRRLANQLTVAVVVIGLALFVLGMMQEFSLYMSLVYALGVAMAMVPQALPAQVTVALATGSNRLAERQAVVKSLPAVETLGATTVICTDKIGTLTKNEMTVQSIWFDDHNYAVSGVGYEPVGEVWRVGGVGHEGTDNDGRKCRGKGFSGTDTMGTDHGGREPGGEEIGAGERRALELILHVATMASNAEIHEPDAEHRSWYPVGDPTEAALVTLAAKLGARGADEDEEIPELHEFSFDGELMRMSSVRRFPDGVRLAVKGSTDSVLGISSRMYRGGEAVPLTDTDREGIRTLNEEYAAGGMRVLAFGIRDMDDVPGGAAGATYGGDAGGEGSRGREDDRGHAGNLKPEEDPDRQGGGRGDPCGRPGAGEGAKERQGDWRREDAEREITFLGLMAMIDPPKEGVREAVRHAREAHIRVFILTGDHQETARAVGRAIGLRGSGPEAAVPVVAGRDFKALADDELRELLGANRALIFARVDPEDKLRIVELLEEQGEIVAVTGDGVNDAPALRKAHIGVAMGQRGNDVAKEAAQLVLLDDNFSTLVHAIRGGRTIYDNLRKTVLASLTTNLAELVVVLAGLAAAARWGYPIPILAGQILAVDLLGELGPLTLLTLDPPAPGVMTRAPRRPAERLLGPADGVEVTVMGAVIGFLAYANFLLFMNRGGTVFTFASVNTVAYAAATAMSYATIVFCQYVNILERRSPQGSLFSRGFFSNRTLLCATVFSAFLVMVLIYVPGIRDFLGFAPLSGRDWCRVAAAAGLYLAVFEGFKLGKRALGKRLAAGRKA
ncbi:MAG: cation-transporting P-type ATPase [Deltaproteobacteria bacterium]|nr:cation-transporting P-type ATPase [Candidatus Anaeroferrophillacea bacterium]